MDTMNVAFDSDRIQHLVSRACRPVTEGKPLDDHRRGRPTSEGGIDIE